MTRYVAFLRAINVGGHAVVKMTDLQNTFTSAGCCGVRTYIQSGNVVFDAPAGAMAASVKTVGGRLRTTLGKEPDIAVRTAREVEALVRSDPFKRVKSDSGAKLYVAFLSQKAKTTPAFPAVSSAEALEAIGMIGRDVFIVSRMKKNGLFGYPNTFIEAQFGVSATTRNWATVMKIADFARREASA